MKKRQLGNSDLQLSEIGFGAWAIGGGGYAFGWGNQVETDAIRAIHKALDLGINWIDTAAVYGMGQSERTVAKALDGIRDEVNVATKCSLLWNEKHEIHSSLAYDSIKRECEDSLSRLNTDRIDLYQIHWPDDAERIEEGWRAVCDLIDEGKVLNGGVSNFQVEHLDRVETIQHPVSLQPPYSMMRRKIEDEILPWCEEHKTGVVVYSPMQCGLLSGSFDINRVQDDDWRKNSNEFKNPNLDINLSFVDQLRPIAEKYEKTVAQLAIAWTLRNEVVTSAIVGARNPVQVEENAGGADWIIDEDDLSLIDQLLADRRKIIEVQGGFIPQ